MATIGYARASAADQNLARQLEAFEPLGLTRVFAEHVSGKDTKRPELQKMLSYAHEGDTIYIHDFSRLARSTKDLLELVEYFADNGITLISLKEDLDTSTAAGKLILTVLAAINQFERENMKERQAEGIAIAKREGKYKGRKPIEVNWKSFVQLYPAWKAGEMTARAFMAKLGMKKTSFYKAVSAYEAHVSDGTELPACPGAKIASGKSAERSKRNPVVVG